ncbi:hypothetical protein M9H77_17812 [Catharanthus roseus]|uniref:Uncharacterized protein n=1 Tax=Catharanthus roseus TaxID=4058 RepID=A0ACC0B5Q9_CATRO|nr:hypothetical protein M9H77_17812 [Catharanthus roseus]
MENKLERRWTQENTQYISQTKITEIVVRAHQKDGCRRILDNMRMTNTGSVSHVPGSKERKEDRDLLETVGPDLPSPQFEYHELELITRLQSFQQCFKGKHCINGRAVEPFVLEKIDTQGKPTSTVLGPLALYCSFRIPIPVSFKTHQIFAKRLRHIKFLLHIPQQTTKWTFSDHLCQ